MRRRILSVLAALAALGAGYLALLLHPQPLFPHSLTRGNVRLYSDRPLPPSAADLVDIARARMARSAWDDTALVHRIFICQSRWRWVLFTLHKRKVGGINCAMLNRNIFLRSVNWGTGRLIAHSGREVEGERDLPYYFAHEMGHGLTAYRIGRWRFWRAESWKKEGFADWLGKADWDFRRMLGKFQAGDAKMDPAGSGFYWKYHLMVGYLLEQKGLTADSLFRGEFPAAELERELRGL